MFISIESSEGTIVIPDGADGTFNVSYHTKLRSYFNIRFKYIFWYQVYSQYYQSGNSRPEVLFVHLYNVSFLLEWYQIKKRFMVIFGFSYIENFHMIWYVSYFYISILSLDFQYNNSYLSLSSFSEDRTYRLSTLLVSGENH